MPWPKAAGSGAQLVKELRNRQVRSYWALGYGFGEFFFELFFKNSNEIYVFFVFWVSCLDVLVFKYLWVCFERFVWKFHIGKLEKMRPFLTNIVEMGLQSLPRKRGKYQWSKNDYKTNTYGSFWMLQRPLLGHIHMKNIFFLRFWSINTVLVRSAFQRLCDENWGNEGSCIMHL